MPDTDCLRVGMVCPYSLSVPGGVQAQVLGLARELRRSGVEVRVLAPCDGPPPDAGVTPLGNSLPTAANGSVAPIAPDVPAQLRTIRALRAESAYRHTPILMLTTEGSADRRREGKEAGATGWIVKPFDAAQLIATMHRVLR